MSEPVKKHSDRIDPTRRKLVMGGAAALLAGCNPPDSNAPAVREEDIKPAKKTEDRPSLYPAMRKFAFTDQDGEPVNIDALAKRNKDKFVTVTFSFSGCSIFCLANNPVLAELDKRHGDKMVNYIIAVNPSLDNINEKTRAQFMETFTKVGLDPKKIKVLYPKDEKATLDFLNSLSFAAGDAPDSHYASMLLYDKDGTYIDRKLAGDAARDWRKLPEQGQGR